jgi:pimeloyl-ACP methyl ester carboxylesterase
MFSTLIREHTVSTDSHTTSYLEAGPTDGPLIIFVHGWPELSISWRNQLPVMAALGFRAIAPDMRGYGNSSVYQSQGQYAQELIVNDMLQLLESLGRDHAIWVGHDWGSPVVWNIASHHPDQCTAVASLCLPYYTVERGLTPLIELVDRNVYPEDKYPAGQWEYMLYYEENFEAAIAEMDANVYNTVKLLFRKGDPSGKMKPSATAMTRINGGWFGGAGEAPDLPRDDDVVSEEELRLYSDSLQRNGFSGPGCWYMNHNANAEYSARELNDGYLEMPVLFIAAEYDYTCESIVSRAADPMQKYCRNLTMKTIKSGHWMAQEKPVEVNSILVNWLANNVSDHWPQPE